MNKLVLSMAFLAVAIPSALSARRSCVGHNECLSTSGKTECCVNNRCETLTVALLNTTVAALQPVAKTLSFAKFLKSTIYKAKVDVPFTFASPLCAIYAKSLALIAKATAG